MFIQQALMVGAGGALGAVTRFAFYKISPGNHEFLSTLFINITGSFIMGLVLGFTAQNSEAKPALKLFLATGFCGGFTTFSAFSAENVALIENGKFVIAMLYILASVIGGLIAFVFGYKLFNH